MMSHPAARRPFRRRTLISLLVSFASCASPVRVRHPDELPTPEPPFHSDGAIHRCGPSSPKGPARSSDDPEFRTENLWVDAARVAGDKLLLKTGYATGCGSHEF